MSAQYDSIAQQYHDVALGRADRKYLFIPTVEQVLGDVTGQTVADLGCGTGFWTEWLAKKGAAYVYGIDESEEMLRIARAEAAQSGLLGKVIEYKQINLAHDVNPLSHPVDLAFAAFLLNYAPNYEAMCEMLSGVNHMLPNRCRFITLTPNPDHPEFDGREYYCTVEALKGVYEGCTIKVTDYHDTLPPVSFEHFWYPKSTYERALKRLGFHSIVWHPLIVSQEGLERFPKGYWERYLAVSNPCVLEAVI